MIERKRSQLIYLDEFRQLGAQVVLSAVRDYQKAALDAKLALLAGKDPYIYVDEMNQILEFVRGPTCEVFTDIDPQAILDRLERFYDPSLSNIQQRKIVEREFTSPDQHYSLFVTFNNEEELFNYLNGKEQILFLRTPLDKYFYSVYLACGKDNKRLVYGEITQGDKWKGHKTALWQNVIDYNLKTSWTKERLYKFFGKRGLAVVPKTIRRFKHPKPISEYEVDSIGKKYSFALVKEGGDTNEL